MNRRQQTLAAASASARTVALSMAAILAGFTLVAPSPPAPAATATNLFVSAEMFASATDCTGQGLAAAPLRTAVDAQDDPWRTGAAAVGATETHMVDIPEPASGNYVGTHPTPMTSACRA